MNIKFYTSTTFVPQKDVVLLKSILIEKGEKFSSSQKDITGYNYLIQLIDKIPNMKFNNYHQFYNKLEFIITQFPVSNNGYINYNEYLLHFREFRSYVRKEFGFNYGYRKFYIILLQFIFLGTVIGLFTNIIGGLVVGCILGSILGFIIQNRLEKKGRILGVREKQ